MSIAGTRAPGIDLAASQEHVRTVVAGSGTSFYWGMRLLPPPKREAMFAIYAFCREVDDIADSDAPPDTKQGLLAGWRAEIEALYAGRPSRPTSLALAVPIERFDLPRAEFDAMIDGMEMDATAALRAPPMAQLERYCRCVAGAVGVLSVHVFGARAPDRVAGAVALGEALQLTNILRDVAEDALRGRVYLPEEDLKRFGVSAASLRHGHAERVPLGYDALSAMLDYPVPDIAHAAPASFAARSASDPLAATIFFTNSATSPSARSSGRATMRWPRRRDRPWANTGCGSRSSSPSSPRCPA